MIIFHLIQQLHQLLCFFLFFNKLNKKVEKEKSSFFSDSSTSTIATNIFLLLDLVQVIGAKLKCVSICNSSSSFSKSTFQNTHTKHEHCPSFSALHSFIHSLTAFLHKFTAHTPHDKKGRKRAATQQTLL